MNNIIAGPTKENNGFDHNFVVSKQFEDKMRLISVVEYPKKMRSMKIFSNQPGVQFYTGNFLPKTGFIGKVIQKIFEVELFHFNVCFTERRQLFTSRWLLSRDPELSRFCQQSSVS